MYKFTMHTYEYYLTTSFFPLQETSDSRQSSEEMVSGLDLLNIVFGNFLFS